MPRTFDEEELLGRVDNDWDFLGETVEMLSADAPGLLGAVRRATEGGDAPAVGRAAHALKGMISNFCAPAALASAFEVEKIGKSGDLTSAPAAVDALSARLDELIAALTELLAVRS